MCVMASNGLNPLRHLGIGTQKYCLLLTREFAISTVSDACLFPRSLSRSVQQLTATLLLRPIPSFSASLRARSVDAADSRASGAEAIRADSDPDFRQAINRTSRAKGFKLSPLLIKTRPR
ncbi:hypothetical protein FF011L_02230 [Roseimaritima multifibrata]|uniref:Uncharacterized protein n=1 Tax=Roseimaritima multifibrata TaxID=1930274 RepID=A0A517M9C0_9BACT|nr:hypothetical protein FF011L_02230 [Roseimaritima multifibrata]